MTLRNLPAAPAIARPGLYAPAEVSDQVLAAWSMPAAAGEAGAIEILGPIGPDYGGGAGVSGAGPDGGGVTARRVAAELRRAGNGPVAVSINSPGGDLFEGLAIHNLLRAHPREVRVRIVGLAASAASIIAMAGDRIEMAAGGFLMIHNSWGAVVGNRHDMRAAADVFAEFDGAMAEIYAARSGGTLAEMEALMDGASWIGAERAIGLGLADAAIAGDGAAGARRAALLALARPAVAHAGPMPAADARRRMEKALADTGLSRADRRQLMRDALAPPGPEEAPFDIGAAAGLIARLRTAR